MNRLPPLGKHTDKQSRCNGTTSIPTCIFDIRPFAVRHEQAQRVLDIATLTGAAGMTFGKHMAPMLADGEESLPLCFLSRQPSPTHT